MAESEKKLSIEEQRILESRERNGYWKRWGPYVSDREWGTVREDYSRHGNAWEYLPHEHARSRAYRWGEDGIAGICDRRQYICFAVALWNEKDPILKERFFGLSGNEGNHGEDVKEYYFYLDSTPTHSYMKMLYKYPHAEFPYARLLEENLRRDKNDPEFELMDTGVFEGSRYFDVFVEYAKAAPEDILVRIEIINRGPEPATLRLLPTIWFRNTWSWGSDIRKPHMRKTDAPSLHLEHDYLGDRWLHYEGQPEVVFTENETNVRKLFGVEGYSPYVKDGINDYIVHGASNAVNSTHGTKAALHHKLEFAPGESKIVRLRLANYENHLNLFEPQFDQVFIERKNEADEFYAGVIPKRLPEDARNVMRQGFGGLLWNKQFYYYEVGRWLRGDPAMPEPPADRLTGRNHRWSHLFNGDVISMPDKWEYPWYAAWDLAFHCIPLALIDPDFAKEQLTLLLREWYMHPNGQLPAYEWAFGDVNPPVHAWAAWRVYKIDWKRSGKPDRKFLERVFHKLLLNFTWWVNRKDAGGRNVFEGGFLGLDNIGVFDRSAPLPTGGRLEQSDATSWMGMYCLNMMAIALELAHENSAYEDVASKFFEHFVYICRAMNNIGDQGIELWDEQDGFYYDVLSLPDGRHYPMRVRSLVGLIPLFAVETLDSGVVDRLPGFKRRMQWFIENRPELAEFVETRTDPSSVKRFLTLINPTRLRRVLQYMLDENEFLSPYGVRSVSRVHKDKPYVLFVEGREYRVDYDPAESRSGLFGGNSNWRGPVWFPVNFLIIESLQKFHYYLGPHFKVEFPVGSGNMMNLWEVSTMLSRRLTRLFLKDSTGHRPVYCEMHGIQDDPNWNDLILFYEYFNSECGAGCGASHQTGWTALVTKLLQQSGV